MIIVLTLQLLHDSVATRMASLRWFDLLHSRVPKVIALHVDEFVPALLKVMSDPSEKVVAYALKVIDNTIRSNVM
jgi:vacuole morphology and inheritance protein 14